MVYTDTKIYEWNQKKKTVSIVCGLRKVLNSNFETQDAQAKCRHFILFIKQNYEQLADFIQFNVFIQTKVIIKKQFRSEIACLGTAFT